MTTADFARAQPGEAAMGATLAELARQNLVERHSFAPTAEGIEAREKRCAAIQKWVLEAMG